MSHLELFEQKDIEMTDDQKKEIQMMLMEGCTLRRVADKFGVSRQRIQQISPVGNIKIHMASKSCIYPNIADWMMKNKYGYTKIAKALESRENSIRRCLTGEIVMKKTFIDGILSLTGMKYEEAFYLPEK